MLPRPATRSVIGRRGNHEDGRCRAGDPPSGQTLYNRLIVWNEYSLAINQYFVTSVTIYILADGFFLLQQTLDNPVTVNPDRNMKILFTVEYVL
jgi:hypothetical protein